MKNTILIFFFLLIGFKTIAQESSTISEEDKIYSFVQEKASPIDGMTIFYQSFIEEFQIAISRFKDNDAKVRLKFIVEKDGTFSNITSESTNADYGKEAIRVLKRMPAWKPAKHNGETVRSSFIMPMKIRVDEDDKKPRETQEKSLNEVEEKNETISETYLKSLDNFLINTDLFEFKCNCTFVKNDNKKDFYYNSQDESAYYQISIEKKDAKEAEQTIKDVKINMINLGFIVSETQLSGSKAVELTINTRSYRPFSKSKMILFYNEGYFIGIVISSEDPKIADAVTQHFKQTFKLKL